MNCALFRVVEVPEIAPQSRCDRNTFMRKRQRGAILGWVLVVSTLGCIYSHQAWLSAQQPATKPATQPTTQPARPEDGQWPMAAKNYANTRYSGLDQINTENASKLQLAWTFSTELKRGHEAAPIIVNNTMYIVTPYPNILYAI